MVLDATAWCGFRAGDQRTLGVARPRRWVNWFGARDREDVQPCGRC